MKKLLPLLVIFFLMIGMSSAVFAITIDEDVITNPASTENLWAYSYHAPADYISSAYYDYVRAGDPYATYATFQGYVTGNDGPWSGSNDSFDSGGFSDSRSVHVFDTYITSSIDQTVSFLAGGDDGHSIFIDDSFMAGAGFGVTATTTLDMVANTEYKLTFIGNNYTGPFGWWFNMRGEDWSGSVSDASNIYMNAAAESAPVPEPATMMLFGIGLLGLAGISRKKK